MRIVSLLASATEIVCALGAEEMLVGCSHECDIDLPRCSEPTFDICGSSAEIDAEVRRRIRSGEPLYRIDHDLIAKLQPDLILTQVHCEVCAVTPAGISTTIPTLSLNANSVEGIFDSILQIAGRIGVDGDAVVRAERARLDAVAKRVTGRRPTVVVIEWIDPLFTSGNWGPELVEIAGGEPLLSHKGEYSSTITYEELKAADPEFIIVAPCGFSLERAWQERSVLEALPGWCNFRHVAFADGNLYFNRSGMTIARTAEIIAEILNGSKPDGEAWRLA